MRKYIVQIITLISGLIFILFLAGLGWTIQYHFSANDTKHTEKAAVKEDIVKPMGKTIVALGDSLTRGTGDESGKGYIGYLVEQLQEKSDEKITLYNLGVKGYRSGQLLNQVQQKSVQRELKQANQILITIGGNDLFQGGQALMDLNYNNVEKQRKDYLHNLELTIKEIRSSNQEATIFLVGLYNPFINLEYSKVTTQIVRQWNFETSQLLDEHKGTVFVPTFDLFQLKVDDYLYSDKFHPNAKGYQLIAERVASLITW